MKNSKTIILFIVLAFLFNNLEGQEWISLSKSEEKNKAPLCKVISSNDNETVLSIELYGFVKNKIETEKTIYQQIAFPRYSTTADIGFPELPLISELIGIPDNSNVSVSIIDTTSTILDNYNIFPFQTPLDESMVSKGFDINTSFYKSSEVYPEQIAEISNPMIWRDVRNISINIVPFTFNPTKKQLRVYTNITVKLTYKEDDMLKSSSRKGKISQKQKNKYSNLILNYSFLEIEAANTLKSIEADDDYQMLIITTNEYENSIKGLQMWKLKKGITTKVATLSETGTSSPAIKNYISQEYDDHDIEYVLFVGDNSDIPAYEWNVWPYYPNCYMWSDYWYGCISPGGDSDYQAEVEIGRFSVSNSTELNNLVSKTINYETNPPISNWTERSLLIAHRQSAPNKYQGCKEEIRNATDTDAGTYTEMYPVFDKAYGAHTAQDGNDATNATISSAINAGRGTVNYRGHGFMEGWDGNWSYEGNAYDYNETTSLNNSTMHPIVFSIACWTGNITHEDEYGNTCSASHSETFTNISNGAVAYLGATIGSPTTHNHTFDKQIYNYAFDISTHNLGDIFTQAKIRTMTLHPESASSGYPHNNATRIAKIYLLCGDPSLEIWSDTPNQITSASVSESGSSVTVNAGISGCNIIVCSIDYGVSYYEKAEGVSSHTFTNVPDSYYVTVIRHNYVPYCYAKFENYTFTSNQNIICTDLDITDNVKIESGVDVVFDVKQDFNMIKNFECELGGTFEVK
ncbi:MAG: C25 family cysteine peptidase [Bacteroidota bacterium]